MNDDISSNKARRECPTCTSIIPAWWVRGYCASCGNDLDQTEQMREIDRLRTALIEIDAITCFDYATMPESLRGEAHKQVREIVLRATARPSSTTIKPADEQTKNED